MADVHLQLDPHEPKGGVDWWWYETSAGMFIFHSAPGKSTKSLLIPWQSVRAALRRKDEKVKGGG